MPTLPSSYPTIPAAGHTPVFQSGQESTGLAPAVRPSQQQESAPQAMPQHQNTSQSTQGLSQTRPQRQRGSSRLGLSRDERAAIAQAKKVEAEKKRTEKTANLKAFRKRNKEKRLHLEQEEEIFGDEQGNLLNPAIEGRSNVEEEPVATREPASDESTNQQPPISETDD
ncbi:MAG: hypothetical protein Q9174_001562 [Haloplaca sp. 1 TL-2023]